MLGIICSSKTSKMKEVSEIKVNVGELVTTSSAKIAKQFNPFGGDNLAVEIPPADEEPKNYLNWTTNTFY